MKFKDLKEGAGFICEDESMQEIYDFYEGLIVAGYYSTEEIKNGLRENYLERLRQCETEEEISKLYQEIQER